MTPPVGSGVQTDPDQSWRAYHNRGSTVVAATSTHDEAVDRWVSPAVQQAVPPVYGAPPANPPGPYPYRAPETNPPVGRSRKFGFWKVIGSLIGGLAVVSLILRLLVVIFSSLTHGRVVIPQMTPPTPSIPIVTVAPPQAVPSLQSLLSASPANGFVLNKQYDRSSLPNNLASDLPPGDDAYGTNWLGPNGLAIMEVAVLAPSPAHAERFATGESEGISREGGRTFAIPGLVGAVTGATIPAVPGRQPMAMVTVARSRVTFLFIAIGPTADSVTALARQAAQTTGSELPVDPGPL